jgi:hypothetical protein
LPRIESGACKKTFDDRLALSALALAPVALLPGARDITAVEIRLLRSPGISWDNRDIMETSTLDLLYLERDPSTKQPSACVCVKANTGHDYGGIGADKLITIPCFSFIELDAEIRRLHAELDEIRSRAKKKFYRAQASTAGA